MGLWDLRDAGNGDLARTETPLVARYRDLIAAGAPGKPAAVSPAA
jgi:hypothetical protein